MRPFLLAAMSCLLCLAIVVAEDKPAPLTTEEAAKKIDEKVTVQFEVKSSRFKDGVCWLNSEKDFKDAKNFTIFIDRPTVTKLKEAKIEEPADHFKGKTVTVTGTVVKFKDSPQIKLAGPDDIKVVEKP